MKKYIYSLKNNYQLYAIALLGLMLVLLPMKLVKAVPYVMGEGLILLAALNLWSSFQNDGEEKHPGKSVLYLGIGILSIMLRMNAIPALGVVWATMILLECSEEIDEMFKEREFRPIPVIWTAVSVTLAVMLMHDPEEHFTFHMRILGGEMIVYAVVCWMRMRNM